MNKLFISLLFLFLIVGVQAEDLAFQFNKQFDLKRPCFDSGFFCSGSFACNITLLYPDGSILINNSLMTNQGSFRNITVTQAQNIHLGFLSAIESCNNVTLAGADTFRIAITGDGKPFQQFPNEFVIIIFGLVMIGVGMVTDRLKLFKSLGSILIIIMGVITLYPGYNFINYSTLMGKGIGFVLIGLGFWFFVEDSFSRNKQGEGFDQRPEFDDD